MCPQCGYPYEKLSSGIRTKKRQRLPNGFGQITKIKSGNLRKPFRAMVTVGKTPEGKPICKILKPEGYFKTYGDALTALARYHANPFDLSTSMTMKELFDAWSGRHFSEIKPQSTVWIKRAWTYCSSIASMPVQDVRTRHLKSCIDNGFKMIDGCRKQPNLRVKENIKSMFNMMFDYALEFELTDRNYSRSFSLDRSLIKELQKQQKGHISFTDEEMKILWDHAGEDCIDIILIQCYTGLRPQELCELTLNNVDLENRTITCGMKTEAGENRIVPIHDCILGFVKERYQQALDLNSEKLFHIWTKSRTQLVPLRYLNYKRRFIEIMEKLSLNPAHRPHDCRKQFTTMAKKYHVDEYAIKKIIGHKIYDITEKFYTDRDPQWLHEEMRKIRKCPIVSTE